MRGHLDRLNQRFIAVLRARRLYPARPMQFPPPRATVRVKPGETALTARRRGPIPPRASALSG